MMNIEEAINCELIEVDEMDFPVGVIHLNNGKMVHIYFLHYKSFAEAKQKWEDRKKRINLNNMFIIFEMANSTNEQLLKDFNLVPYKNKIAFVNQVTNRNDNGLFALSIYNKDYISGKILHYQHFPFSYKMYLDEFDYVKWLNKGI